MGLLRNDSAQGEDNDTDVSAMECDVEKMLCMNGTGHQTRLRHERYLYAQLRKGAEDACAQVGLWYYSLAEWAT
jgi:hypothetical protein